MKFTSETTRGELNTAYRHGRTNTRTYRIWAGMLTRCTNANTPAFVNYGGRGIKVCERWKDFRLFLADMGECPSGCSIDRIDNDGDYAPGNCRWATRAVQNNNSRHNRRITVNGVSKTIEDWSRYSGIKQSTLSWRLKLGWPEIDLLLPVGARREQLRTVDA